MFCRRGYASTSIDHLQFSLEHLSGIVHSGGTKQFWNIAGDERAIVITLDPTEEFDRLMVTADDPHQVVDDVNSALGAR